MLLNSGVWEESWVPWTARRSNQSILKEINVEYSLEGLMLKLRLQYFGHLMRRADSLENTLMLGKIEDRRRRGWQRMRWLDDIIDLMDISLWDVGDKINYRSWWWTGRPGVLQSKELDMTERLNWTVSELKWTGMGEFNSDDNFIYYCGRESLRRNEVALIVNKKSPKCSTWVQSQKWQNDLFVSKANHSVSQQSKSMPKPLMPKKM